jgi:2,3-bisphosphoglycerate-independent phosphoglycerate mutase
MDRDKRWDRIERAYGAMVLGKGEKATDPVAAIKRSYERGVTDEFIEPITIVNGLLHPVGLIRDDDACIFFNFRADRGREMTQALTTESPSLPSRPKNLHFTTMTEYDKTFRVPFVLSREHPNNILADVMAQLNWKNLRVAETEKYAHVTYFFNGGNEKPYPGESRELVPSPKVATYDLKPEMSAAGIADAVVKAVKDGTFDVIIVNFANADMVGHSGKIEPTVKAVETVDACLGRIEPAVRAKGGAILITADHGNAEMLIDPVTGSPHTAHTTNPVPFIVVSENSKQFTLKPGGSLRDISPTMLAILEIIEEPQEMTGHDLRVPLKKN